MSVTKNKIDQKEYLKRYLSNDKDKKKKKKKKDKHTGKVNVKIIDDDDFAIHQQQHNEDESDLFAQGDEAPQIVGIIDERPPELKAKEDFNSSKWKKLTVDSEEGWGHARKTSISTTTKIQRKNNELARENDSDESPLRRTNINSKLDQSPPRRKYVRRDSDASPKRREKERLSPRREKRQSPSRQYPDSDESPARHRKQYGSNSLHKSRKGSDSDQSPPRKVSNDKSRRDASNRDLNSKYRRDHSPQRKRNWSHSQNSRSETRSSDENVARRREDSDESPPRRRQLSDRDKSKHKRSQELHTKIKQEVLDSDESPPRQKNRTRFDDSDPIPSRRIKIERESPPAVRIKREPRDDVSEAGPSSRKMMTTLDGKVAGLQDARAMKVENDKFRQRENEIFEKMSDETSGRYAKTVVREKRGKRREDIEEELRKDFEKRKRNEKKKEIYTRWGKGVKQVEEYKAQLEEAAHEMNKPLARYADDQDLDEHLKKQERIGDPMLDYIRSKKKEKAREEGRPEKPLYKGSFADNRFGIRPGYRWDGVDRSNGFEKKWFEMTSKKKAVEEEAYKYSVEDM
ncbi:BUD13 homolog [Malaya genurostris]|uniref:BUD13 homolog n=1 Tax=Malaya genurostris TaxID=325434 RepID=UPI0026F3D32A|nr:BUD13 homolog [Malaya genurostris]